MITKKNIEDKFEDLSRKNFGRRPFYLALSVFTILSTPFVRGNYQNIPKPEVNLESSVKSEYVINSYPDNPSKNNLEIIADSDEKSLITINPNHAKIARRIMRIMPESQKYLNHIFYIADKYKLKPEEICAVIEAESSWNPNAESNKGAKGLMQLNTRYHNLKDPYDPIENIERGAGHLAQLKKMYKNPTLVYAAYNAGEGNVNNWISNGWNGDIDNIPIKETKDYVGKVRFRLSKLM